MTNFCEYNYIIIFEYLLELVLNRGYSNNRTENKILQDVEKTITSYKMIEADDYVLVGVSGGPDSVALLHLLLALSPQFSIKLGVAHLNHSLRLQDSDNDAEFVESMCLKLNLPLYIKKVDVQRYQKTNKISLEEAARRVRYDFFNDVSRKEGFNKIALGHHLDDNAELILMNIFRGSGSLGISGIPPVRSMGINKQIVRPLIGLRKSQLIDYLSEKGLTYVLDTSNEDTNYVRNEIRFNLIPYLEKTFNPNIAKTLNQLALISRSEEGWKNEITRKLFEKSVLSAQEDTISFHVAHLVNIHASAKRRMLRMAIERIKKDLRRITFRHVDAAVSLLEAGSKAWSIDLPEGLIIYRKHDTLFISKKTENHRAAGRLSNKSRLLPFTYSINKPESGQTVIQHVNQRNIYLTFSECYIENLSDIFNAGHSEAFFDIDVLSFPLELRNLMPGDCFSPLGIKGTQKVKKYFINKKIPVIDRIKSSILLSRGKIIWVVGHQIDDFAKVTALTKKILKVEIIQSA